VYKRHHPVRKRAPDSKTTNHRVEMNQTAIVFLVVAVVVVFLAMATVIDAECKWLDCHAHSAGDWCNILGPGWSVKDWRRCNGLLGKSEKCCN
ncbi:hypothetical protein, partial [Lactiplantibacillus plantarum]|uniref:hypothetical protein n=1 Tax=Lactiplantibacillus plantarum TaxID=1590 RepID=UPI0031012092